MDTKPKLTNRVLADIYGTSERQISRWRAENAPLRDIDEMIMFWLCRKSYPRHLQHLPDRRKAEMQRRLDAFDGARPEGPVWLDYIRSISEGLCDADGDIATLREHPEAPAAVRAKAKELTKLLHSFTDAFHDGFAAAGIDEDAEIIGVDSFWKRERKQNEAGE